MDKKKCISCKFWDYKKDVLFEEKNIAVGYCRKNAPEPSVAKGSIDDEYQLVWPLTTGEEDYCWEFDVKEN